MACTYLPGHLESLSLVKKISGPTINGISSFFLYFNSIWPKQREKSWQDVLHSPLLCASNSTLKKKNSSQIKYHLFQLRVLSQHHSITIWNAEQCKKICLTVISFHLMYSIRLLLWKDFTIFKSHKKYCSYYIESINFLFIIDL